MNNIQKAFKTKSKLRAMADGGPAKPTGSYFGGRAAQLDAAMADAGVAPARQRPAAAPAPAQKPDFSNVTSSASTTPAHKPKSAIRKFLGLADGGAADVAALRQQGIFSPEEVDNFNAIGRAGTQQALDIQQQGHRSAMDTLANAAAAPTPGTGYVPPDALEPPEEELADGGDVQGKGGPTDDKVGPVALSDGEYVLPADTVDAVGIENLDALRMATHDFKDSSNKPKLDIPGRKGLRGMAAGGVFYVDPEGNATRSTQPGRAMVPAQPAQNLPSTNVRAPAASAAEPLRAQNLGATPAAQPGRMSALRNTLTQGGGRVGNFARGAAPIGAAMGAFDAMGDDKSGYRAQYNNAMGVTPQTGAVGRTAADTARVMENVGDTMTFGLAGRLGRGLSGVVNGEQGSALSRFASGFMSDSDRTRFAQQQAAQPATGAAPAAAPALASLDQNRFLPNESGLPNSDARINRADPNSRYASLPDDAVIGTFNGRPITKAESDQRAGALQTASFQPPQPQGGGSMVDQMRSLLREFGNSGGGGGGFAPRSNAREINERYDRLSNQLSGMYSRKGQGNLARHLVNLENQRASALDADSRNLTTTRGQDMQSVSSAAANRTSALQAVSGIMERQQTAAAKAQADALKTAQEAQEAALKRDEAGLTDIREAVRARFGEDSALAESTLSRILSAGQDQIGRITSLTGQDRASAIEDLLDSANAAQQFDDQQSSLWGNTDTGLPRATETRDPRFFRDVFAGGNRALPALGREVKDLLGFDGRVMVDDNGRVAPLSDDLRQRRTTQRAVEDAPRRSRLREDN